MSSSVISANTDSGVLVDGGDNLVAGNRIGTHPDGSLFDIFANLTGNGG